MNPSRRPFLLAAALLVLAAPVFADRDEDEGENEAHEGYGKAQPKQTPAPGPGKVAPAVKKAPLGKYTAFDVALHSSPDDAWIIVGQKVYDISGYASAHSGGDVFLLGGDNTKIFAKGHGTDPARINRFLIGTLVP